MTQPTYTDLEIHIRPRQEDGYPVDIRLDGEQAFQGTMRAGILPWISSGDLRKDGQWLFDTLFADTSLRDAWVRASERSPDHRRIRLWIDTDAPELHAVPWELLHDGDTFLAADAATPLSRYLPGIGAWGYTVLQGPLRVLAVIANPTDLADYKLAPLDIVQERSVLNAALDELPPNRRRLDVLDAPVTLARLEDQLRAGNYHILHLVAHGVVNQRQGQAALYLQDDNGQTEVVTATDFAAMLERLEHDHCPHLVFLAACQTAAQGTADAFRSFGPTLLDAGIPAVVAMQDVIAIRSARTLSGTFYGQLAQHGAVDVALNAARGTLLTHGQPDAVVPVLFLRRRDGQVWRPPARHDFYQHIPLPQHYLPRPDVLATVKTALLANPDGLALTAAVQMNALHGMGGIGKTVLARALCEDAEVQATFPDGILWATLGQTPNLTARLREWVETLGGISSENAPTPDQLKNKLVQLLAQRACLLVVDDVWQYGHAEAFQVAGPSCRMLLTTRDAEIPRALGATLQPVDVLPPAQAVALLEQWAEGNLDDTNPDLKQCIIARLGCLPLALKLAGAQLRRKDPARWLKTFDARKLKLRRTETLHDSLEQTFALSIDELSGEDWRCYTALAIFKEDEAIPFVAIAKLWGALAGLDEEETTDLLDDLAARALLQLKDTPSGPVATLHDLLRDFITAELGEQDALAAHRALLEAYRTTQTGEGWHTMPDDGYLYAHLAYHLYATSDYGALKALFDDDHWLHARVSADDYIYDGYLADLSLAWQWAQAATTSAKEVGFPLVIADCVHYALIHTTVNSLASNYEPALVARAIETSLWPPERGLSIARRVVGAEKQAWMIVALLKTGCLSDSLNANAQCLGLVAIRTIENERQRTEVLITLASQLTGEWLIEGLALAQTIKDKRNRVRVLGALLSQLVGTAREQVLMEGITAMQTARNPREQVKILATLAPYLTDGLLTETLATACAIGDERYRAEALATLAPYLTDKLLTKSLKVARAIDPKYYRVKALAALTPYLADTTRTQTLMENFATVCAINKREWQAEVLATLASQLTDSLRDQALSESLKAIRAIEKEWKQIRILLILAPRLTGDLLQEGLAMARAIKNEWGRAMILAKLAPEALDTNQILNEALMIARMIKNEGRQVEILATVALQLAGMAQSQVLMEALQVMRTIENPYYRTEALVALAPLLTDDLLMKALTTMLTITDEYRQAIVLAAFAWYFKDMSPNQILTEALLAAYKTRKQKERAWALAELVPQLSGTNQIQALKEELLITQMIKDEWLQVKIMLALAPLLSGDLLGEVLRMALRIKRARSQVEVLMALIPQLTGDLLMEALAAIRALRWEEGRAKTLMALIPQIASDDFHCSLLAEALAIARGFKNKGWQAEVLAILASYFTDKVRSQILMEALAAAQASKRVGDPEVALVTLIRHLSADNHRMDWLTEILTVVCAIKWEKNRLGVLMELASQCVADGYHIDLLKRILAATREIEDEGDRTGILLILVPQFTGMFQSQILTEALAAARAIKYEESRVKAFLKLAHHFTDALKNQILMEALATAREINKDESRARCLAMLAPRFTDASCRSQILADALAAACAIEDEWRRALMLSELVPQLAADDSCYSPLVKVLASVATITNKEYQLRVLIAMTLSIDISDSVTRKVHQKLLLYLWELRSRERADLLSFLAKDDLSFLQALSVTQEGYNQIAQSVTDVCTKWEWI
ncbi:MAG: CHAT domain-containing protein [Anaerolineae bacterium]|nr:CHAT domain-containing protein [Anaerolineae bacterium]